MDPLSDVLSLLKLRSYMCGGFDMGGELAVSFGAHDGIKCYAIVSGRCWLVVEGVAEPVGLEAGDCFLLPRGRPFRMASDLALTPVDAHTLLTRPVNGGVITINGGGTCACVGGFFALAGAHAEMMQELREPQPGSILVAQQLAFMMLVQALRLHLAEGLSGGVGWLFALADPQMSVAISAIHGDPGHRWSLQELAERAGMSRSIFALRFKETVGSSPMEYLARWRMLLAGDKLTNSSDPIGAIAQSLGYESESAFSTAFKRIMGASPREYCRGRKRTLPVTRRHSEELSYLLAATGT
jgi:AraC-like DNA-binding protein